MDKRDVHMKAGEELQDFLTVWGKKWKLDGVEALGLMEAVKQAKLHVAIRSPHE